MAPPTAVGVEGGFPDPVAPAEDEALGDRRGLAVGARVAWADGRVVVASSPRGGEPIGQGTVQLTGTTLRVPGHPGWVAVGPDAVWVALNGDPRSPVGDRPLVRLDLVTGAVSHLVHVNGEVSFLARIGEAARKKTPSIPPMTPIHIVSRNPITLPRTPPSRAPMGRVP